MLKNAGFENEILELIENQLRNDEYTLTQSDLQGVVMALVEAIKEDKRMKTFYCNYCGIKKSVANYRKDKFCSRKCASLSYFLHNQEFIEKRQKIIDFFKKIRSYSKTGKKFNLSRQRIEQIIKKNIPEFVQIESKIGTKYFNLYYGLPCKHCGKKLKVEIKHEIGGYCINCRYYYKNPDWKPKQRYTECSHCKKFFTKKSRNYGKGLCQRCYHNYRYYLFPEVRRKMKESSYKWHKQKIATDPVYKEKYNKYQREWRAKV